MKKVSSLLISIVLLLSLFVSVSNPVFARTSVKGYFKNNGTYVAPHYRSSPNQYRSDNWSSKYNYNPYTGKKGYKSYWP